MSMPIEVVLLVIIALCAYECGPRFWNWWMD